jgi:hypothetical protein
MSSNVADEVLLFRHELETIKSAIFRLKNLSERIKIYAK